MKEAAQAKRTPIQHLEVAIRDWPSNPDLYLKLASLYLEKGASTTRRSCSPRPRN